MVVRLSAALFVTGLAFATPCLADQVVRNPDLSLDLREGEVAGPTLADMDALSAAIVAQVPLVEHPEESAELQITLAQTFAAEPITTGFTGQGPTEPVMDAATAALDLARDDTENFSWMIADLPGSMELTTGSLAPSSASSVHDGEAGQLISPLTDDALRIDPSVTP